VQLPSNQRIPVDPCSPLRSSRSGSNCSSARSADRGRRPGSMPVMWIPVRVMIVLPEITGVVLNDVLRYSGDPHHYSSRNVQFCTGTAGDTGLTPRRSRRTRAYFILQRGDRCSRSRSPELHPVTADGTVAPPSPSNPALVSSLYDCEHPSCRYPLSVAPIHVERLFHIELPTSRRQRQRRTAGNRGVPVTSYTSGPPSPETCATYHSPRSCHLLVWHSASRSAPCCYEGEMTPLTR